MSNTIKETYILKIALGVAACAFIFGALFPISFVSAQGRPDDGNTPSPFPESSGRPDDGFTPSQADSGDGTVNPQNPTGTGDGQVNTPAGSGCTQASGSGILQNPLKFCSIGEFFIAILDIIKIFGIPIVVFFLIWSGFLYVTAQGNPEKIQTATRAFMWTIVGGLLVIGAWVLVGVIEGTVEALR